MEKFVTLLIPALVALVLVRLLVPVSLPGADFSVLRFSVPVAAQFRRGIHGGVFPHQRRDGAGGGISGIARNRRYGAAGSFIYVIITQYRPPHLGGRYALLIQMYVQMGIGHGDALLVKDVLDPLGQGKIHVPVVLGLDPDAKGVGNGAVAVAAHAGAGGGG